MAQSPKNREMPEAHVCRPRRIRKCRKLMSAVPEESENAGSSCLPSPKGANVNNRWWNDRREWNLRIADILSIVPEGGEQEQDWMRFAPFGDAFSLLLVVRRFHDLRSFHQRLLKVGPLRGPNITCIISVTIYYYKNKVFHTENKVGSETIFNTSRL